MQYKYINYVQSSGFCSRLPLIIINLCLIFSLSLYSSQKKKKIATAKENDARFINQNYKHSGKNNVLKQLLICSCTVWEDKNL